MIFRLFFENLLFILHFYLKIFNNNYEDFFDDKIFEYKKKKFSKFDFCYNFFSFFILFFLFCNIYSILLLKYFYYEKKLNKFSIYK